MRVWCSLLLFTLCMVLAMENCDFGNEHYEGSDDSTEEFSSLEEEEAEEEPFDISLLSRPIGSNQPYLCLTPDFFDSFNLYDNDFSALNASFSYAVGQEIVLFKTGQLGGDVDRVKVDVMVSAGNSKYMFPSPYKFSKLEILRSRKSVAGVKLVIKNVWVTMLPIYLNGEVAEVMAVGLGTDQAVEFDLETSGQRRKIRARCLDHLKTLLSFPCFIGIGANLRVVPKGDRENTRNCNCTRPFCCCGNRGESWFGIKHPHLEYTEAMELYRLIMDGGLRKVFGAKNPVVIYKVHFDDVVMPSFFEDRTLKTSLKLSRPLSNDEKVRLSLKIKTVLGFPCEVHYEQLEGPMTGVTMYRTGGLHLRAWKARASTPLDHSKWDFPVCVGEQGNWAGFEGEFDKLLQIRQLKGVMISGLLVDLDQGNMLSAVCPDGYARLMFKETVRQLFYSETGTTLKSSIDVIMYAGDHLYVGFKSTLYRNPVRILRKQLNKLLDNLSLFTGQAVSFDLWMPKRFHYLDGGYIEVRGHVVKPECHLLVSKHPAPSKQVSMFLKGASQQLLRLTDNVQVTFCSQDRGIMTVPELMVEGGTVLADAELYLLDASLSSIQAIPEDSFTVFKQENLLSSHIDEIIKAVIGQVSAVSYVKGQGQSFIRCLFKTGELHWTLQLCRFISDLQPAPVDNQEQEQPGYLKAINMGDYQGSTALPVVGSFEEFQAVSAWFNPALIWKNSSASPSSPSDPSRLVLVLLSPSITAHQLYQEAMKDWMKVLEGKPKSFLQASVDSVAFWSEDSITGAHILDISMDQLTLPSFLLAQYKSKNLVSISYSSKSPQATRFASKGARPDLVVLSDTVQGFCWEEADISTDLTKLTQKLAITRKLDQLHYSVKSAKCRFERILDERDIVRFQKTIFPLFTNFFDLATIPKWFFAFHSLELIPLNCSRSNARNRGNKRSRPTWSLVVHFISPHADLIGIAEIKKDLEAFLSGMAGPVYFGEEELQEEQKKEQELVEQHVEVEIATEPSAVLTENTVKEANTSAAVEETIRPKEEKIPEDNPKDEVEKSEPIPEPESEPQSEIYDQLQFYCAHSLDLQTIIKINLDTDLLQLLEQEKYTIILHQGDCLDYLRLKPGKSMKTVNLTCPNAVPDASKLHKFICLIAGDEELKGHVLAISRYAKQYKLHLNLSPSFGSTSWITKLSRFQQIWNQVE